MESDPPTSTDTAITNFPFRPDFFQLHVHAVIPEVISF